MMSQSGIGLAPWCNYQMPCPDFPASGIEMKSPWICVWITLPSATSGWPKYVRSLRASLCCPQSAGLCTIVGLPVKEKMLRIADVYRVMKDELISDNGWLLKGSKSHHSSCHKRVIPVWHRKNMHALPNAGSQPECWATCPTATNTLKTIAVVPDMHQAITYTSNRGPPQPWCSPQFLVKKNCYRSYGLGQQKVPSDHSLLLQVPLLFQTTTFMSLAA